MVSIDMEEGDGIGLDRRCDERGSSRRNSRASCSLSSSAGGSRRVLSISFEAASTSGPDASARADHGPDRRQVGRSRGSSCPSYARRAAVQRGCASGRGQFLVDLLDRLAPGLECRRNNRPRRPSGTSSRDRGRRSGSAAAARRASGRLLEPTIMASPSRTDDLADAAEAIGRAHAGCLQVRAARPRRRRVRQWQNRHRRRTYAAARISQNADTPNSVAS